MRIKKISKLLLVLALSCFTLTSFAGEVFRAQFTTQISDREPVDNISKLDTSFTRANFFTDVRDCVGCTVEHKWFHNSELVFSKKTKVKYARFRWWTNVKMQDRTGKWTVMVYINGSHRVSKELVYFKPSEHQKKNAPIQKRMQQEVIGECEDKLKHFHEKTKEFPDDPYYKFMLNKWGKRCYGE